MLEITERKAPKNSVYLRKYIVKLKAAKLCRFLSQINAKFFNVSQANFRLFLFAEKLTASCDGC